MESDRLRSDAADSGDVTLRVPGENRFLEVLRGVVGRAARISGFSYSGIEDFSLAVDEAAVILLERKPLEIDLRLTDVGMGAARLTAVITLRSSRGVWPPSHDLADDMRWQVLTALCEEVWLVDGDEQGIGLAQTVR